MAQGFKYAKLVLDEPRDIYYSGQVLNGHIECDLPQPVSYSAITINYNGKATVHWVEGERAEYNGVRTYLTVTYSNEEEYFNVTQCISGGMGVVNLPPGVHRIPFQFLIPSTVPSSYTSERGQVRYTVTAYIDYPDPRMERDELSKEFEVVAPMDLNKTDEYVQRPTELEIEEMYSCCCSSSPLNITLSLPAAGYCPGQCIPIHVKANNQGSVDVKKIIFLLVKKEAFHSREPKSDYIPPEEVLLETKTKPIMGNSVREFTVDLVVPDMIAPNLENCNIINVGFFLKVIVEVSGCNDNYENETELFIGLVPISSLVQQYVHPLQSDLPNAPIPKGLPNPPIQNTAVSPNNASYPNRGYPNVNTGYNTNSSNVTNHMPRIPAPNSNIGFVVPATPPGTDMKPPYPMGPANAYVPYSNFASPSAPPPN